MIKSITLFIFISISLVSSAQETKAYLSLQGQKALFNKVLKSSDSLLSTEPLYELLESDQITIDVIKKDIDRLIIERNPYYLAESYGLYERKKITDTTEYIRQLNRVFVYTDSIKLKGDCDTKISLNYTKYVLLKKSISYYDAFGDEDLKDLYENELSKIHIRWKIPQRDGYGLGIEYQKGKDHWLGFSLTLGTFYSPVLNYSDSCNGGIYNFKPYNHGKTFSVNAISLAYSRSFESGINEISFSFFEFNAPVSIMPARFGFQFQEGVSHPRYYYRPVLGFGIGPFSISYAYNFMLN